MFQSIAIFRRLRERWSKGFPFSSAANHDQYLVVVILRLKESVLLFSPPARFILINRASKMHVRERGQSSLKIDCLKKQFHLPVSTLTSHFRNAPHNAGLCTPPQLLLVIQPSSHPACQSNHPTRLDTLLFYCTLWACVLP